MGKRRIERGPEHDELVGVGAAPPTSAHGTNVADHVLGLQRDYGNNAVTTMVQRAPKSRAASTDAPSAKKGKGRGKKAPVEENYAPTSLHYNGTLDQQRSAAMDYWHGTNGKSMDLEKAAKYMEDAWLLTDADGPARAIALNVSRIWKEWSEPKRAAFWMKVHTGELKPKVEDMTGKEF